LVSLLYRSVIALPFSLACTLPNNNVIAVPFVSTDNLLASTALLAALLAFFSLQCMLCDLFSRGVPDTL
jgi:thioredoxin-related protein